MLDTGSAAPAFRLKTLDGHETSVEPGGAGTLLVFLATDCPTCQLTLPYIDKLGEAFADQGVAIYAISQDGPRSTRTFVEALGLKTPVLMDEKLEVTRLYDPVSVPTLFLVSPEGEISRTYVGFSKNALNEAAARIGAQLGMEAPIVAGEHDGAPAMKPGCGSRHTEPGMDEGGAEPDLSGMFVKKGPRASRIELPTEIDPYDYCLEHGFGDPLPVVPPTAERVERFLAATSHDPAEVIALVPPNYGMATVEKIAANAVMAGCAPEMMKVLIHLVRAVCDETFNIHGIQATTHFATPLILINGPIRNELSFHSKKNLFSNVARANSTLGRALQLILSNIGGCKGDESGIDMSALGNPGKFSYCIAENEEENPWEPFHVTRGFKPEQSTITLFAAEPPTGVSEHNTKDPIEILRAIAHALRNVWTHRACMMFDAMVILCPEHVHTIRESGMTKNEIRDWLFNNTGVPQSEYEGDSVKGAEGVQFSPMYGKVDIDGVPCYRKFRAPESIHLVVAGGTAGKFSAVIGSWLTGPRGSEITTYPID
jgi:peroxiredoxin